MTDTTTRPARPATQWPTRTSVRTYAELLLGLSFTAAVACGGYAAATGHMAVAAGSQGSLMVRADPADGEEWADGSSVTPMEMRGRPMAGWLLVAPDVLAEDDQLQLWVDRGVAFVRTLPPK